MDQWRIHGVLTTKWQQGKKKKVWGTVGFYFFLLWNYTIGKEGLWKWSLKLWDYKCTKQWLCMSVGSIWVHTLLKAHFTVRLSGGSTLCLRAQWCTDIAVMLQASKTLHCYSSLGYPEAVPDMFCIINSYFHFVLYYLSPPQVLSHFFAEIKTFKHMTS